MLIFFMMGSVKIAMLTWS